MTTLFETPSRSGALPGDPRTSPLYELYRRFRAVALASGHAPGAAQLARQLLAALLRESERPTGVLGGRLYQRRGERFERVHAEGADVSTPAPGTIAVASRLVEELGEAGWLVVFVGAPELQADNGPLAPGTSRAWLLLGERRDVLVAFTFDDAVPRTDLALAMATLHSLADLVERRRELSEALAQARIVQTSLLPEWLIVPQGFAAAVRSRPAQIVGGDLYDLLPGAAGGFALAIGDATGHGLAAALQARDAVVGLRMAMAEHLKLAASLTRISRVVSGNRTAGRFVSLAVVEVDRDGSFVWANAGHVSPLLLDSGGAVTARLDSTGPVLGLEESMALPYGRAFGQLAPGGLLALYTDGIVEAEGRRGEEFGENRLVDALAAARHRDPEEIVAAVFEALDRFTDGAAQLDDQTLVVLRRPPAIDPAR